MDDQIIGSVCIKSEPETDVGKSVLNLEKAPHPKRCKEPGVATAKTLNLKRDFLHIESTRLDKCKQLEFFASNVETVLNDVNFDFAQCIESKGACDLTVKNEPETSDEEETICSGIASVKSQPMTINGKRNILLTTVGARCLNSNWDANVGIVKVEPRTEDTEDDIPHARETRSLNTRTESGIAADMIEPGTSFEQKHNGTVNPEIDSVCMLSYRNMEDDSCYMNYVEQPTSVSGKFQDHLEDVFFSCSECKYRCLDETYFKRHMLNHTGEKPFACSECTYKCSHNHKLKKHMLTHSAYKPFSCQLCKYTCSQKNHLKTHMLTHTAEKPFSCSECKYKCSQKGHLKTHMLTHTGERPLSCPMCKYTCSQHSHLKSHMLIHTGEKPHACPHCRYVCSQKWDMKKHLMTHTGEKPFSCTLCSYSCSRKWFMKNHMLTHTGGKIFSCSVCKFTFSMKRDLKRHTKTHIGEIPITFEVCE